MNFSERVPSSEWTALSRNGEELAEAWFKPDDEPLALVVRVPQHRFELDDLTQQLTLEDLLTAAGIPLVDIAAWHVGDESHSGLGGTNPELQRLLPSPPPGETHLAILVQLNPPGSARTERDLSLLMWQGLDALWLAILTVEAGIENLRQRVDSLRSEMEGELRRQLGIEEKTHALQADVAQWTKAKSRVHYAIPKAREFIHRATWALGTPERKRLDELYRTHIEPRIPFPELDHEREQLEHLQKDRQVLSATGNAVYQECRGVTSELQRALSTLQRNAADRARSKRSASKEKGKHF